jgi:hypothetical protein
VSEIVPLDPTSRRSAEARELISRRFIEAAEEATRPATPPPLATVGFIQIQFIRPLSDGSLSFTVHVPSEYMEETFVPLTRLTGVPVTVYIEQIELPVG